MRFPFFSRPQNTLQLKLPKIVEMHTLVFAAPSSGIVDETQAFQLGVDWAKENVDPALLPMMLEWLATPLTRVVAAPASIVSSTTIEHARKFGARSEYIERIENARDVYYVQSSDALRLPRMGIWAMLALAYGIAKASSGIIVEGDMPIPYAWDDKNLASRHAKGLPLINKMVLLPHSSDSRGMGWLTTIGMQRFGLPEFQVEDIPAIDYSLLSKVLGAVIHRILAAIWSGGRDREPPSTFHINNEFEIDRRDLVLATGDEAQFVETDDRGPFTVRVLMRVHSNSSSDHFLTLLPPANFNGPQSQWLSDIVIHFFGTSDPILYPDNQAEMDAAHQRAVHELPQLKGRFAAGMPEGTVVAIKYGVPVDGGSEYLWAQVIEWKAESVTAILMNACDAIPEMRVGYHVSVPECEIYDWIVAGPRVESAGGYTNDVLTRSSQ